MLISAKTPARPWAQITMDFTVELPDSKGCCIFLTIVDQLTKMAHFIPCAQLPTAENIACLIISHVFHLHGLPDQIISDQGPLFVSQF